MMCVCILERQDGIDEWAEYGCGAYRCCTPVFFYLFCFYHIHDSLSLSLFLVCDVTIIYASPVGALHRSWTVVCNPPWL
jgi:hypothetical protein